MTPIGGARTLRLVIALLLSSLGTAPVVGAQELAHRTLAPGVQMLSGGPDGNVLVVDGADARLVVDGQAPGRADVVLAAIDELEGPPVRWVVNTHFHEDHRGLNAALAERGATVVSHREARALMQRGETIEDIGWTLTAAPAEALPGLVTAGDLTLHLGGMTVRLLHMPAAHTAGDLAVYVPEADVILAGDVFELGAWPFLDLWHGGTVDGLVAAADRLLEIAGDDTVIVPGHGPPSDRATVARWRDVIVGLRDKVDVAIAAGQTYVEFADSAPTRAWDDRWGGAAGGRRLAIFAFVERSRVQQGRSADGDPSEQAGEAEASGAQDH